MSEPKLVPFEPATIKLKVLVGPPWSEDPVENELMNEMVNAPCGMEEDENE